MLSPATLRRVISLAAVPPVHCKRQTVVGFRSGGKSSVVSKAPRIPTSSDCWSAPQASTGILCPEFPWFSAPFESFCAQKLADQVATFEDICSGALGPPFMCK